MYVVWTREFSTVTRDIHHGANQSDPYETRTSRVNRTVVGRVGSDQQDFKSLVGSGRVGSRGLQILRVRPVRVNRLSNLAGRVWSVQRFSKYRGSGRIGSRRLKYIAGRAGPGEGRVESGDPTRPDQTREV